VWRVAPGVERDSASLVTLAEEHVTNLPDGTWLATGSRDGTVRVWDALTGTQRTKFTGHRFWVTAVAVAPDSSWLATCSRDGTVRVCDL
jgi:WD40 repeat protein